jgi:hypothetical protein
LRHGGEHRLTRPSLRERARLLIVLLVAAAGALALAGCGSSAVDSDGFTAHDRTAAQSALDELQNSNIPLQLVTITKWVQKVPSACRIHPVSQNSDAYDVYVFWTPYLAAEPYVWLNMKVTGDPRTSTFHLGTSDPVLLPGGRLNPNGRSINQRSVDTTVLSRYGAQQDAKNHKTLVSHGGDVFAKPSATCQLLTNGSLKLLPK